MKDPLGDRRIKEVPRPPAKSLSFDRVFPLKKNGIRYQKPNVSLIKQYIVDLGTISKELMIELVNRAK